MGAKDKSARERFLWQSDDWADPVLFVRPAYDDYPAVTTYSVYRDYDPVFYGRQPGTRRPVTAEQAAKG